MPVTYDLSRFKAAVARISKVSKKTGCELLNHNLLKVAIGSSNGRGLVHYTRKATAERIKADMRQIVPTVTESPSGKRARRTYGSAPRIIALAAKYLSSRGVRPLNGSRNEMDHYRQQISNVCAAILAAKLKSRAYIAAGWLWAARDLSAKVPGRKLTRVARRNMPTKEEWTGGSASQSWGVPASPNSPVAALYNTSRGANIVVTGDVYQAAINDAIHDMNIYMVKKMAHEYARAVRI